MLPDNILNSFIEKLEPEYGSVEVIGEPVSVSGGSINNAFRVNTNAGSFFIKYNRADLYPGMFEVEAKGLQLLDNTNTIKVPKVVSAGNDNANHSFLILKFLEAGQTQPDYMENFGMALAKMHRTTNEQFGLDHNNYIGSLPQTNNQHNDWPTFFIVERLETMIRMAKDNGRLSLTTTSGFERLFPQIETIFPKEPPALLHGDLWSGNYLIGPAGSAFSIDPAVYFGHREMDIAMSRLFGGFDSSFYMGYQNEYPMEQGWEERTEVCNLYPLMVHVNLFGGGYLQQVESVLRKF